MAKGWDTNISNRELYNWFAEASLPTSIADFGLWSSIEDSNYVGIDESLDGAYAFIRFFGEHETFFSSLYRSGKEDYHPTPLILCLK